MADLFLRDVDDAVAAALAARAARAGRSVEAEHRRILEEALGRMSREEAFEAFRVHRIKLPPGSPSTTDLLREDRDRGG